MRVHRYPVGLFTSLALLMLAGGAAGQPQPPSRTNEGTLVAAAASSSGPKMKTARLRHAIATLPDGRVVLFGGVTKEFVALRTAEIWDPASNRFARRKMKYFHDSAAMARLPDGRYLLAGGAMDRGVPAYDTAEIFDPTRTKFSPTKGRLTYRRHGAAAATLASGDVLIAGGWYQDAASTYPELFRVKQGTFSLTGPLANPRAYALVLPTADGRAVVLGGTAPYGGSFVGSVERYDPKSNAFAVVSAHLFGTEPAWFLTDAFDRTVETHRLADGRYMYLAFKQEGAVTRYGLFTFDPVTQQIVRFPTTPALPDAPAVILFQPVIDAVTGKAHILGYVSGTAPVQARLCTVDVRTGALTAPPGTEPMPRDTYLDTAALTLLQDGRLFVTGGYSEPGSRMNFSAIKSTRFWQLR